MKSLNELSSSFFVNKVALKEYEDICNSNLSTLDKIYKLMTFNPGFMTRTETYEKDHINRFAVATKKELKTKIDNNETIRMVAFYFNAKPSIFDVSGGITSPDASDYLVLLHLNFLTKHIQSIYKPGASIRIGNETSYFHKAGNLTRNQGDDMHAILVKLNLKAETESKNHKRVILYDLHNAVDRKVNVFYPLFDEVKLELLNNDDVMDKLYDTSKYYLKHVIDENRFNNTKQAELFSINHVVNSISFRKSLLKLKQDKVGFFKYFDEVLYVQTRFTKSTAAVNQNSKPEIYCSMLPGSKTFSFNMLTLRMNDGLWKQVTMKEIIKHGYKPYYVQDLPYPFFYTEGGVNEPII